MWLGIVLYVYTHSIHYSWEGGAPVILFVMGPCPGNVAKGISSICCDYVIFSFGDSCLCLLFCPMICSPWYILVVYVWDIGGITLFLGVYTILDVRGLFIHCS